MLLKYLNDKSNFYLSCQMLSLFDLVLVLNRECSAGLTERHVLVGAEESHHLGHLARETLVGGENLLGGGEGRGLVHPELSTWLTTSLETVGVLNNLSSLLESVLLDHGSHEDIIGISGESGWGNSLV